MRPGQARQHRDPTSENESRGDGLAVKNKNFFCREDLDLVHSTAYNKLQAQFQREGPITYGLSVHQVRLLHHILRHLKKGDQERVLDPRNWSQKAVSCYV